MEMPHKFTQANDRDLEGVWVKPNGRRFCRWRFDAASSTLRASRGVVVSEQSVDAEGKDLEALKEELPRIALELANQGRSGASASV